MLFRRACPRHTDGDVVEIEGRPVRLAVNNRARRVSLRLDPARREVVATAPTVRALPEAVAFARSRSEWITARLDRLPRACTFEPGATVEMLGAPVRLERAAMRIAPRIISATADEPARLIAHGEGESYARAVERALRAEARRELAARTALHCAALTVLQPTLTLTDARGRWGSCRQASGGRPAAIRYSWRLVLATPAVLDYVAAHECAHLIEANHGPRFWAVVRELYGDPGHARGWLKANGARLHAIGRG